jgi:hypothetical protein
MALAALTLVAACTATGRVYPMNDLATQTGVPVVDFVRGALDHGPVTITMPNGEVLVGEYQITENAGYAVGFAGGQSATAFALGGGRPVAVSATGPHGAIMNCDGTADIGGHGSLICEMNSGARYRVMF